MASPTADAVNELTRSTALLTTGLNQLHTLISQISTQVASVVQLYSPNAFLQFTLAVRDTTAALGRILTPALNKFQILVRGIGDVLASVNPSTMKLIQAVVAAGIGIGAMTAAVVALDLAINSAMGGIPAIIGLVVGAVAGLGFALKDLGGIQAAVNSVMRTATIVLNAAGKVAMAFADSFRPVFASLSGLASRVGPFIEQLASKLVPVAVAIGQGLADAFAKLMPAVEAILPILGQLATVFIDVYAKNMAALLPVFDALAGAAAAVLPPLVKFVAAVLEALIRFDGAVTQVVAPLLKLVLDVFAPVRAVLGAVLEVAGQLISVLSGIFSTIVGVVIPVLNLFAQAFGTLFQGLAEVLTGVLSPVLSAVSVVGGAFDDLNKSLAGLTPILAEVGRELGKALGELFKALLPILPEMTGPLLAAVRVFAGIIHTVADGIRALTDVLRELLGIVGDAGVLDTFSQDASRGLAVRNVEKGTLEQAISKAQLSAFQAGRPVDDKPEVKAAGHLENIDKNIANLPKALADAIKGLLVGGPNNVATAPTANGDVMAARQAARQITG